jgi:hypothetical protein
MEKTILLFLFIFLAFPSPLLAECDGSGTKWTESGQRNFYFGVPLTGGMTYLMLKPKCFNDDVWACRRQKAFAVSLPLTGFIGSIGGGAARISAGSAQKRKCKTPFDLAH